MEKEFLSTQKNANIGQIDNFLPKNQQTEMII
jgi:hypothetical protein